MPPHKSDVRFARLGGRIPFSTDGSIFIIIFRCKMRVTCFGFLMVWRKFLTLRSDRPYNLIHSLISCGDVFILRTSTRYPLSHNRYSQNIADFLPLWKCAFTIFCTHCRKTKFHCVTQKRKKPARVGMIDQKDKQPSKFKPFGNCFIT